MNKINSEFFSKAEGSVSSERAKALLKQLSSTDVQKADALDIIFSYFKGENYLYNILKLLLLSLLVVIIINIFNSIFNANPTIKYAVNALISLAIIQPIYELTTASFDYMRDLSAFLGVLAPTVGIITASGGNINAAAAHGLFFSVLLGICQIILNYLLPLFTTFFIGIAIIDIFGGNKRMVSVSQFVRNTFFVIFSMVTAILFIIINFYNTAAVGNDSVSSKAMRLLISNSIPIIGGTIGDALKLLSGGIITAKNSIGLTSVIFILAMCLPFVILLFIYSTILNFFGLLCDYFEVGEIKGTLIHLKCAIDFILATFSIVIVLAFINIGVFMSTVPSVISL